MRRTLIIPVFCTVAAAVLLLPAAAAAAPGNDNFLSAQVVSPALPQNIAGTTVASTTQGGEPDPPASGRTVWYSFTPSSTTHVFIGTCENPAKHNLNVWTGDTLTGLTPYTSGSDAIECPGAVNNAQAIGYNLLSGVTYRLQLRGFNAGGDPFTLRFFKLSTGPSGPSAACKAATAKLAAATAALSKAKKKLKAARKADASRRRIRSLAAKQSKKKKARNAAVKAKNSAC